MLILKWFQNKGLQNKAFQAKKRQGKVSCVFLILSVAALLATPASASWLDKISNAISASSSGSKASSESTGKALSALSNSDISAAFKEALELGSRQVVSQLGTIDGFNNDSSIRIPLPDELNTAKQWLDKGGMGASLSDLEVKLNRAAEKATPQAEALFIDAIKEMSFDDVRRIYQGPEDSATRYFESKMTKTLTSAMSPIVSESLSEVGAIQRYDEVMSAYKEIPLVPDIKADLTQHVIDGGLKGIFHYLAQQESAIRQDPVKQTTALLQKVFGNK